ncbi:type II toxin-antitoxin system YafQ family toxin [Endothiovibrio diazotrophicus]
MFTLRRTGQFKRDLKRAAKDPKRDLGKLKQVIETLLRGEPLPPRHQDHLLAGNWKPHRECHIQPDFLLIYRVEKEKELILVRCGSHNELFG